MTPTPKWHWRCDCGAYGDVSYGKDTRRVVWQVVKLHLEKHDSAEVKLWPAGREDEVTTAHVGRGEA